MSKLAKHLHLHRDTVTVENESPESTSPKAQDQHLGEAPFSTGLDSHSGLVSGLFLVLLDNRFI